MKIITMRNTREQARSYIKSAKLSGASNLKQPVKRFGKWFIETKDQNVLSLKTNKYQND